MSVIVVAHDPEWAQRFESEAQLIHATLGPAVSGLYHIGSTAIPGIYAKPVIDILAEVTVVEAIDDRTQLLVDQGYDAKVEFGLAGRRYFRKLSIDGVLKYHVHAYAAGSAAAVRYLAFRDYLRSHPDVAQEYSELKRRLAARYPSDMKAYMDGKDPFIKATERAALAWWWSV